MNKTEAEKSMRDAVAHFSDELRQIRTGRAHPGLVEDLPVEAYGSVQPLKGLASVSTPEARVIQISPWDKSIVKAIEKAIQNSKLGLNPTVQGEQIRLRLPDLTAERREELVKMVTTKAEAARVVLRNIRESFLKSIKDDVAAKIASQDALDRGKKEIQSIIDAMNQEIEKLVDAKSTEIRSV
jgi:ribosome recycling factor